MFRRLIALSLHSFLFVTGCSKPYEASSDPGSGRVLESYSDLTSTAPSVRIIVIDDVDSVDGAAMRKVLTTSLVSGPFFGCRDELDAADHDPLDLGLILVPASNPEAAFHPGNTADLLVRAEDGRLAIEGHKAAIEETAAQLGTKDAAPPRYVDALNSWLSLLSGERKAENAAEEALVALYPHPEELVIQVAIAALRADESNDDLANFVPDLVTKGRIEVAPIRVWRGLGEGAPCEDASKVSDVTSTKLGPLVDAYSGTVGECVPGFYRTAEQCYFPCVTEPVFDAKNRANCVVSAFVDPKESCNRPGWSAPDSPDDEFEEFSNGKFRRCDIAQLQGAALESCETDPLCTDCEPGFCVSDYNSIKPLCSEEDRIPVRFPLGTDVGTGMIRVTCELPERTK